VNECALQVNPYLEVAGVNISHSLDVFCGGPVPRLSVESEQLAVHQQGQSVAEML
jgi:hypothetical protein